MAAMESELELKGRILARKAAGAGMVLLKNEGRILPLEQGKKAALFGCGAEYTIKGGTGSGDVHERYSVNILNGLENAGLDITSRTWLGDFRSVYEQARLAWKDDILSRVHPDVPGQDFFSVYSTTPFENPGGREITEEDYRESGTDTAIYVISRNAGEGKDRNDGAGDWKLSEEEEKNICSVAKWYSHVILIINAGGPIDLSILDKLPEIQAVIYMSQAGMEGGNALGLLLTGEIVPSGKMTDSWAFRYEDYPNAASFSYHSGDTNVEEYTEGIYVGYRYFDTFDVPVRYSFGHGLSYTDFQIEPVEILQKKDQITVSVSVRNVGEYAGAEVVQVYVSCPQGTLRKEKRRLCGFSKTEILNPGMKQKIEISFPVEQLASFDEKAHAYVLDSGKYGVFVGNGLDTARIAGVLTLDQKTIVKQVSSICPLQRPLEEIAPDEEKLKIWQEQWQKEAEGLPAVQIDPQFIEEKERPAFEKETLLKEKEIVSCMTLEQKISLLAGRIKEGPGSQLGSAGCMVPGSAGETVSFKTEKEMIPGVVLADGPAGLRLTQAYQLDENGNPTDEDIMDSIEEGLFSDGKKEINGGVYYQYCSAIPVGTLLAQTWDLELLQEAGKHVGQEMEKFGVTLWLAPGMNIHRNPLCGRNFEYYSEDPLISGMMGAAITKGVQSVPGVGTTIKHLACNNQEDNRIGSDSIISERALREIYLRGFEIAVHLSQPMAIMTSYNLVNGTHAANSYDLCIQAARKEWGFKGLIMTDWFTTLPEAGSIPFQCIKAGNDLIMPGGPGDLQDIRQAYDNGDLQESEIEDAVCHILHIVLQAK